MIAGRLARATLIGAATGCRSTMGIGALGATGNSRGPLARPAVRGLLVSSTAVELVIDKLPRTPSRLRPAGLVPRVVLGAATAVAVCRRGAAPGEGPALSVVAAALGAAAALDLAWIGSKWRAQASSYWGSDLPGAVLEDVTALAAALVAARSD